MTSSIRNLVICVFRDGTRILVGQGFDDVKNETFMRPLGGAVEFGERAADALRREIREELGVEITDLTRLGVLENVFTYQGQPGHELVLVYDARFVDPGLYAKSSIPLNESVWDGRARWIDLSTPPSHPLFPDGLAALLDSVIRKEKQSD